MATSILRKFSAWRSSREEKASLPILVTPSTRSAISSPNSRSRSLLGGRGVLEDVVEQAGRHRGDVHLEVRRGGRRPRGGERGTARPRRAADPGGRPQRTGRRARAGPGRRPAGTSGSPRSASESSVTQRNPPVVDHMILRAASRFRHRFFPAPHPSFRRLGRPVHHDGPGHVDGRVGAGDDARRRGTKAKSSSVLPPRNRRMAVDRKVGERGQDGPRQRLVDGVVHLMAKVCPWWRPCRGSPAAGRRPRSCR